MKVIDGRVLYKFITGEQIEKSGFSKKKISNMIFRVRRFYCGPMNVARKCTGSCLNCKVTLLTVFQSIDKNIAKDPEALLTYTLRQAVSNQVEVPHEATVRKIDRFGTADPASIWDAMLAEVTG